MIERAYLNRKSTTNLAKERAQACWVPRNPALGFDRTCTWVSSNPGAGFHGTQVPGSKEPNTWVLKNPRLGSKKPSKHWVLRARGTQQLDSMEPMPTFQRTHDWVRRSLVSVGF
ncbi:hypothetical protein SLEP1_g29025 [Rubroshorea leprosula]|uniref:Uncharacterized protein n=1 Tax=Rubroshorea leprosula TaxID=152421 RepID=A0AAV5K1A2_9ROSI|nr:hypothetical protein SLEP1_g29025 [Rubroshorea leprosula]